MWLNIFFSQRRRIKSFPAHCQQHRNTAPPVCIISSALTIRPAAVQMACRLFSCQNENEGLVFDLSSDNFNSIQFS